MADKKNGITLDDYVQVIEKINALERELKPNMNLNMSIKAVAYIALSLSLASITLSLMVLGWHCGK